MPEKNEYGAEKASSFVDEKAIKDETHVLEEEADAENSKVEAVRLGM